MYCVHILMKYSAWFCSERGYIYIMLIMCLLLAFGKEQYWNFSGLQRSVTQIYSQLLKIRIILPWKLSRLIISCIVFFTKLTFWYILIYFGSYFICRLGNFGFYYTGIVLRLLCSVICCIWLGYLDWLYLFFYLLVYLFFTLTLFLI